MVTPSTVRIHLLNSYWFDRKSAASESQPSSYFIEVEGAGGAKNLSRFLLNYLVENSNLVSSPRLVELAIEQRGVVLGVLESGMEVPGSSDWSNPREPLITIERDGRFVLPRSGGFSDDAVARAIQAGMLEARPHEYLLTLSEGRGGDGFQGDLVAWLLEVGVDIAVGYSLHRVRAWLTARLRGGLRDRRARWIAAQWRDFHGIHSPHQLRLVIDTKSEWDLIDVERGLGIDQDACKQLLRALGYVPNARSAWVLGTGKRPRARRAHWMKMEHKDPMGAYFENQPRGRFASRPQEVI